MKLIRQNQDLQREIENSLIGDERYSTLGEYLERMSNYTEWAEGRELALLSRILQRPIAIIRQDIGYYTVQEEESYANERPIFLHYTGNHYEPLVPQKGLKASDILESIRARMQNSTNSLKLRN